MSKFVFPINNKDIQEIIQKAKEKAKERGFSQALKENLYHLAESKDFSNFNTVVKYYKNSKKETEAVNYFNVNIERKLLDCLVVTLWTLKIRGVVEVNRKDINYKNILLYATHNIA